MQMKVDALSAWTGSLRLHEREIGHRTTGMGTLVHSCLQTMFSEAYVTTLDL